VCHRNVGNVLKELVENSAAITYKLNDADRRVEESVLLLNKLKVIENMASEDPRGALAALQIETSPSKDPVSFARHTPRQVSSPSHLKHTRQSIAAALALRISSAHRRRNAEQNRNGASSPLQLANLLEPSSGAIGGRDVAPSFEVQDATELDSISPPKEPFYTPNVTLETFTEKHLTSPRQKNKHSMQSLAASLQLRKEMFSSAPISTLTAESVDRKRSSAAKNNAFSGPLSFSASTPTNYQLSAAGVYSVPEQKINRVIRTPLTRQRHVNINHYDPVRHVWRPSHVPPPNGVK
jgi:hypothetical protein